MSSIDKQSLIKNWGLPEDAKLDQPITEIRLRPRQYRGLERLEIHTLGGWVQKGGLATEGRPEGFSQKSITNLTKDAIKKLGG